MLKRQMHVGLVMGIAVRQIRQRVVTTKRLSNVYARKTRTVVWWHGRRLVLSSPNPNVIPAVGMEHVSPQKMHVTAMRTVKVPAAVTVNVQKEKIAVFARQIAGLAPEGVAVQTLRQVAV